MPDKSVERSIARIKLTLNLIHDEVLRALGTMREKQTTANDRLQKMVAEMKQVVVWCGAIGVGALIAILGTLRNWF